MKVVNTEIILADPLPNKVIKKLFPKCEDVTVLKKVLTNV